MIWVYANLVNGRLIDIDTNSDCNINFPNFKNYTEANKYVRDNDLRISIK